MKVLRFVILSFLLSGCMAPSSNWWYRTGILCCVHSGSALQDSIDSTNQMFANERTNAAIEANTMAIDNASNAAIMNRPHPLTVY